MPLPPSPVNDAAIVENQDVLMEMMRGKVQVEFGCWLLDAVRPGRKYATLSYKRRHFNAHRCVLLWFKPNSESHKLYACHLCKNKNCVNPEHLYWGTHKQNIHDSMREGTASCLLWKKGENHMNAVLSTKQVREIYERYRKTLISTKELAPDYGVTASAVQAIVRRRSRTSETADLPDVNYREKSTMLRCGGRSAKAKITDEVAREIYLAYGEGLETTRQLGKRYGIQGNNVSKIINKITWKHATEGLPPIGRVEKIERMSKGSTQVSMETAIAIRKRRAEGIEISLLMKEFGVSKILLTNIVYNRTWRNAELKKGLPAPSLARVLPMCRACGQHPRWEGTLHKRCQDCVERNYHGRAPGCACGCGKSVPWRINKGWAKFYPPHNPRTPVENRRKRHYESRG